MRAGAVLPFAPYFPPTPRSDDAAMRWVLPIGRSPWAIAAGYLGLLSILGVFGPFAIITGILGIQQIQRNQRLHGMGRAIFGIIAGSLGTVLLLVFILGR